MRVATMRKEKNYQDTLRQGSGQAKAPRTAFLKALPFLVSLCLGGLSPLAASTTTGSARGGVNVNASTSNSLGPTGANYYASPAGSDSNAGTLAAPFASLAKLCQSLSAGQTGMMRGGLYTGQSVTSCAQGSSGSPITIANYPGETPVISAGALLTGWSGPGCSGAYSGLSNCYYTTVPSSLPNFEALWYNGVRRPRARNLAQSDGAGTLGGSNFYLLVASGGATYNGGTCNSNPAATLDYNTGDVRGSYYNANDVEFIIIPTYVTSRMRVCSVAAGVVTFTGTLTNSNSSVPQSGRKYLIENSQEDFLAGNGGAGIAGTWYLDCGSSNPCVGDTEHSGTWTLYYLANTGEAPGTAQIMVGNQTQLMSLSTTCCASGPPQYLTFQGLTFFAFDNFVPGVAGFNANSVMANVTAGLAFVNPTGIIFTSDILHGNSGIAVAFSSNASGSGLTGDEIINSLFYDIGSLAWELQGSLSGLPGGSDTDSNTLNGVLIQNDAFEGVQRYIPGGEGGCGTILQGHGTTINHVSCDDAYAGGFVIGSGVNPKTSTNNSCALSGHYCLENTTIENSVISNVGHGVEQDFGCVHWGNNSNASELFTGNVCHDVVADTYTEEGSFVEGFYSDANVQHVTWSNNVLWHVSGSLIYTNSSGVQPNDGVNNGLPAAGGMCSETVTDPLTGDQVPGCDNHFTNNILAMGIQGGVTRGQSQSTTGSGTITRSAADLTFAATHNIFWMDASSGPFVTSNVPGQGNTAWGCQVAPDSDVLLTTNPNIGESAPYTVPSNWPPPCSHYFAFGSNVWYSTTGASQNFYTTDPGSTNEATVYTWIFNSAAVGGSCTGAVSGSYGEYWESAKTACPQEDGIADSSPNGSQMVNPGFQNAAAFNWNFVSTAAYTGIGFTPFTSTWLAAGPTSLPNRVPVVPQTFPNQNVSAF
jgi:hypothetical protein